MTTALLLAAGLALTTLMLRAAEYPVGAQDRNPLNDLGQWQSTQLTGPVGHLFASGSGALFARTQEDLLWSDDAGGTWNLIPLPASAAVAVDPTDDRVVYAAGPPGLYKTADRGLSWQHLRSLTEQYASRGILSKLAISAADSRVVYFHLSALTPPWRYLIRSRDGGATWETLEEREPFACRQPWVPEILEPHPTQVQRLFRTLVCYGGSTFSADLSHSDDQGATWSIALDPRRELGLLAYPKRLVGGQGNTPQRFYLSAHLDFRVGGSTLLRRDNDSATWTELLTYRGGGTDFQVGRPEEPNVQIVGLQYNPAEPDRVYLALIQYVGQFSQRSIVDSWVQMSRDGGHSWVDVGGHGLGDIRDLVVSTDGHLYAATDQGLWRLNPGDPSSAD